MDDHGMEAFFDTFLFLTIICVASCIVFDSTMMIAQSNEAAIRSDASNYALNSLSAILISTLQDVHYWSPNGSMILLANSTTIEKFLLEESYLVSNGWSTSNFLTCNDRITAIARSLISNSYDFSLETELTIGDVDHDVVQLGVLRQEGGYSAAFSYNLFGDEYKIRLRLWWT